MKLKTVLFLAVAALILTACSKPTPEEVTRQFTQALADGDCELAKTLTIDAMAEHMQGNIDAGCPKFNTTIKLIECEEQDRYASCSCTEIRDGMEMTFVYELQKVDDSWKIYYLNSEPWK